MSVLWIGENSAYCPVAPHLRYVSQDGLLPTVLDVLMVPQARRDMPAMRLNV